MTTSQDYTARHNELRKGFRRLADEIPGVANGFFASHRAAQTAGALDSSMKELIALAVGIAVHCDGCIAFHVHDALDAGATHEQIVETIGVAVMMGGGPSMVYGSDALTALEQFEEQGAAAS